MGRTLGALGSSQPSQEPEPEPEHVKHEERATSERSYNGIAKTLGAGSPVECRALQLDNGANIGIFAPHVGW